MAELHVFGSGIVRIGDVGATLTSTNQIGSIQSIDTNVKYDKKELFNTPIVSLFPVDVGFHNGEMSVKLSFKDINRAVLAKVTNTTAVPTGSAPVVDVFTITKTSKPAFMRLEADMIDTAGKNVKVVLFKCYATELPISAKIDDFADISLEVFCLPDPSTGSIGTIAMDQ